MAVKIPIFSKTYLSICNYFPIRFQGKGDIKIH